MITVERVRTHADLNEFIAMPRRLYRNWPEYCAPLDHDRRQMLDPRRSAFFTHGEACYWIARRGEAAVGRISAQIDFAAIGPDASRIGLFGCLDAIDDAAVVGALFRAAEDWLRARKRSIVRGPFLLSINGESGLLVDGQHEPHMTLFGWHPAYMAAHVEAAGYAVATRLFCYRLGRQQFAHDAQIESLARARSRAEITVEPLRLDALASEMEVVRRMFNDGWRENWGFTPATETDVAELVTQFKPFIFADSGFFVLVRGEPAAFALVIPNIFDITADLGPRPSPLGWLKLLYRIWRQPYRGFRLVLIGIAKKYQDSVVGGVIGTVMFDELRKRMQARPQVEELTAGWILEQNHRARRPVEMLGFRMSRIYNLYEKAL